MPKIKSFAPSWLNEPSPGHRLFEPSVDHVKAQASLPYGKKPKPGPRRTIARRGTEVFVAAGKEIRWGDLVTLKESWETTQARSFDGNNAVEGGYRVRVVHWIVSWTRLTSLNRQSGRPSPTTSAS